MLESLQKYLVLYKRLHLPGIGFILIEDQPAHIDFVSKIVHPPLPELKFALSEVAADKQFYRFLSADLQLQEVDAIRRFNDFFCEMKDQVTKEGVALLPGIGALKKQLSNDYIFEPLYQLNDFFPDVNAERVIRKETSHLIRVGEDQHTNTEMKEMLAYTKPAESKWWLYAIILAAAGVAALIYYHVTKQL